MRAHAPGPAAGRARRGTEPVSAIDRGRLVSRGHDRTFRGAGGVLVILSCGCERLPAARSGHGPRGACDPAVMTWHEIERAQLAEALLDVAPDAPTLCEGWQARHLAAHVVLRERSPMVGAGIAVPALVGPRRGRDRDGSPTRPRPRAPTGTWWPGSPTGPRAGTRPPGSGSPRTSSSSSCTPRTSGAEPARSRRASSTRGSSRRCGRTCRAPGGTRLRSVPVGVVLVRDDGVRHHLRAPKADYGTVVVRGDVGELVLYLLGRGAAADVRVEGDADDVATIEAVLPSR